MTAVAPHGQDLERAIGLQRRRGVVVVFEVRVRAERVVLGRVERGRHVRRGCLLHGCAQSGSASVGSAALGSHQQFAMLTIAASSALLLSLLASGDALHRTEDGPGR